jgi:hypothetical protein
MKLLGIVLCICLLFFVWSCKTETVTITATWTQEITDQSNFGGWEIYMATSENGTYSRIAKIPFVQVKDVYSYFQEVDLPADKPTIRWFKMLAYNKTGEKSEFSNKVKFIHP